MNNESKMSVTQLTILTAVNMMGSGIIMLPAKLAEVGGLSIVSWLVTAIGSMCLAYVFAKCGMYSRKQGGMNGYAEYTFGKSGSFICSTTYSFSLVIANIAIATSAVGYGSTFLGIRLDPITTCMATIGILWLTTFPNFGGASITGRIGTLTIWGVILPIFTLCTFGWFFFSGNMYATNWNVHDLPFGEAATNAITMTLWSFLGMESACANCEKVKNPEKSVPVAVLGGTFLCAVVYIISTNIMFGILPAQEIFESSAPFGLAFAAMFNNTVGHAVMGMMCIACLGSLLGWQFTVANVFKIAADVGDMPKFFAVVTEKGTPIRGMFILGAIQTVLALMTISPTLNEQFEQLVNLATVTNIIPYILSMAAVTSILKSAGRYQDVKSTGFIAIIASVYSLYACYASGLEAMTYAGLFTFACWTFFGFIGDHFNHISGNIDGGGVGNSSLMGNGG